MSSYFLFFTALFCGGTLAHFHLYALQNSGYHTIFKLKKVILSVALPITEGLLGYFLWEHTLILDYSVSSVSLLCGVVALVLYLKKRTKFRFTARGLRVAIPFYLLSVIILSLIFFFPKFKHLFASLSAYGGYLILALVNGVIAPFEHNRNAKYATLRTEPLRKESIIRVVITGSYGKTTCRRILSELLKSKYEVVSSINNYNTPLGLVRSVENHLEVLNSAENLTKTLIFIGEAGAKRKGDISEMCRLIAPSYGIITGVAEQHLDSFRTIERVASTKEELAKYVGASGTVVFNVDNPHVHAMSERFSGKAVNVGRGGDIQIENLKMTARGSTFNLRVGDEVIPIKTELLGAHNVLNIALCVALALELKVDKWEIQSACARLKAEPHRLERRVSGTITILDDGYNANIMGVRSALKVLGEMDGRKVIYAQGIVECGAKRRKLNREVGRLISGVAGVVILSGENAKIISKALKKSGFQGKIYKFSSLMHATSEFKNILKSGDILYLQNDIP